MIGCIRVDTVVYNGSQLLLAEVQSDKLILYFIDKVRVSISLGSEKESKKSLDKLGEFLGSDKIHNLTFHNLEIADTVN